MKNMDLFTKRILTIALALSMVLCSVALVLFSLNFTPKANAAIPVMTPENQKPAGGSPGAVSCAGIQNGFVYYVYNNNEIGSIFWKVNVNSFKDAEKQ